MVHFLKNTVNSDSKNFEKNNSWPELFNFQNSFNCHGLNLLKTTPLPIHEVIKNAIF